MFSDNLELVAFKVADTFFQASNVKFGRYLLSDITKIPSNFQVAISKNVAVVPAATASNNTRYGTAGIVAASATATFFEIAT